MNCPVIKILDDFPEPEFTNLRNIAFADFGEHSDLLAAVLADEANHQPKSQQQELRVPTLRLGAWMGGRLAAWSYSRGEGNQLHMINSGVLPELRRHGIYSRLVQETISYATSNGFVTIISRHSPSNNGVIIAKLRLGFLISGFEYSEVYGPLVRLTYLIGRKRHELYQARAMPIIASVKASGHVA